MGTHSAGDRRRLRAADAVADRNLISTSGVAAISTHAPATSRADNQDQLDVQLAAVDAADCSIAACRSALQNGNELLLAAYHDGALATDLIARQSQFTDQLLLRLWAHHIPHRDPPQLSLIAVGGYGREELHPRSDIDILILTAADYTELDASIGEFVTALWDVGMDVGHSVRDIATCVDEASRDLHTITNLLECRLLAGSASLHAQLCEQVAPDKIWPAAEFFIAKRQELRERHIKFQNTAYRLEPNLKESPGALRDIHTIQWLLIRQHGSPDLQALVADEHLTESELTELIAGRNHLWRIRFLLHHMGKRKEDRLLFDFQRNLALAFGYPDEPGNEPIEKFMQQYYRTVSRLERLTSMLLQLMQDTFVPGSSHAETTLNKRFVARNHYLEAAHSQVFENYPPAILELFQVYAAHDDIQGIGANTLRLLRSHLHLIDGAFRADMIARDLFMQLFREPQKITRKLRMMNRYGVLAGYLPAFEKIVGRMQYDLFHIYTVDEHTIMVIRNLRRFALPQHCDEFPHCSAIMETVDKPELLYIIALFHDIAKGRGGDHSILGAEDADYFCKHHGMNAADSRLVVWTIRHHLDMSMTAQRKDISDPQVVQTFASLVGSQRYLDFLYLLTVADIRGTNPELWNSWKENLLRQLYDNTQHALARGLDNPIDKLDLIQEKKAMAREQLSQSKMSASKIERYWKDWLDTYFLRYSADEIRWHTETIAAHKGRTPLIALRHTVERGSTEILIHTDDRENLFATVAAVLDRLGLTIVNAQIMTSLSGKALDTFFVLDRDGSPITEQSRASAIRESLVTALADGEDDKTPAPLPAPHRLQHFTFEPIIEFTNDDDTNYTSLAITAIDRPGLLSLIGHALAESNVRVIAANIATFGEKAEDVFHLQDSSNGKITDHHQLTLLHESLTRYLTEES